LFFTFFLRLQANIISLTFTQKQVKKRLTFAFFSVLFDAFSNGGRLNPVQKRTPLFQETF
jgi:hypothetical protein